MTALLPQHAALIHASGISPEVAAARGYFSITRPEEAMALGFASYQAKVPGLVVPVWGVDGTIATYQLRPDAPRVVRGKSLKYETPRGARMVLDVPPAVRPVLGNPTIPLIVTEGVRKADAAVSHGGYSIALLGVWNWRGTNGFGGKTALADWESIALNGRTIYLCFDSDAATNPNVMRALDRLEMFLKSRGAA